jgi:hypothetical protein
VKEGRRKRSKERNEGKERKEGPALSDDGSSRAVTYS